ncbi:MAG: VOC family protein [Clostridiales Family XIII bacterium]|nr:VOC family protein [Clostridiales Family XIII bacterium]
MTNSANNAQAPAAALPIFVGGIDVRMLHHIHIIVEDIETVRKAYEGVPGVDNMEVHDIRKFNGALALMVRTKPVSIEYLQITDPTIGMARLLKDAPLGLNAIDLLVSDGDAAVEQAKAAGYILTGKMRFFGCWEIWLRHPKLELNIEFMVPTPPGYKKIPNDKPEVWIYGLDGTEDLYFS